MIQCKYEALKLHHIMWGEDMSTNWMRVKGVNKLFEVIWDCIERCDRMRSAESGNVMKHICVRSLCSVTHCVSKTLLLYDDVLSPMHQGKDQTSYCKENVHLNKSFHVFWVSQYCFLTLKRASGSWVKLHHMYLKTYCNRISVLIFSTNLYFPKTT